MDIRVQKTPESLPTSRAHVLRATIALSKGCRDVEVHLFRAHWPPQEKNGYDWDKLITPPSDADNHEDVRLSQTFLLEAFTETQRDQLLEYLQSHYQDRITAVDTHTLTFPLPAGIVPLSTVQPTADRGIIEFEKIPHYTLPFTVHGFYDLSRHLSAAEA